MQSAIGLLKDLFPGLHIVLIVGPWSPGISNYISNGNRADVIEELRETADRLERNQDKPTAKKQAASLGKQLNYGVELKCPRAAISISAIGGAAHPGLVLKETRVALELAAVPEKMIIEYIDEAMPFSNALDKNGMINLSKKWVRVYE